MWVTRNRVKMRWFTTTKTYSVRAIILIGSFFDIMGIYYYYFNFTLQIGAFKVENFRNKLEVWCCARFKYRRIL
jgi:hypothetical protein